jgi:glycosyltransferase involved in cell wall biosynthesis
MIYIPYNKKYYGGPGTFIKNLTNNYEDQNFTFELSKDTKYILVITYYSIIKLIYYKIRGKKIIQRLDGLGFISEYSIKGKVIYLMTYLVYKFIAHIHIFQSIYIKKLVIDKWGLTNRRNKIIYNGVCTRESFKVDPNINLTCINLVYWGSHITKPEFILLEEINLDLRKKGLNTRFTVMGKDLEMYLPGKINENYNSSLDYLGVQKTDYIYESAKDYDLFIMIKGSPSPNALVECLSLGLPVVGFDDKGNSEIIDNSCGILFPKSSSLSDDVAVFSSSIISVYKNHEYYTRNIKEIYKMRFSCEIMRESYLDLINN